MWISAPSPKSTKYLYVKIMAYTVNKIVILFEHWVLLRSTKSMFYDKFKMNWILLVSRPAPVDGLRVHWVWEAGLGSEGSQGAAACGAWWPCPGAQGLQQIHHTVSWVDSVKW